MFWNVAAFELRYQLKNPVLWVSFAIFFLLTFASVTVDTVQIGSRGNANVNSPHAIGETMGTLAIFAQFVVVAFVANVIVRDDETRFGPILRATRISKFDYLYGRFLGAFAASLVAISSIPLAMIIGSFMPWLDPERLGPFVPMHYAYGFFVIAAPTLFLCAAMFFALATVTRSMLATYVGLIGFMVLYLVLAGVFSRPEFERPVALLEPFGLGAIYEQTKYWTASDRNTRLPPLGELFLLNRAIWGGVALLSLAAAYWLFRFEERTPKRRKSKPGEDDAARALAAPPKARREFGLAAQWRQALERARFEFAYVLRSPAFVVLMALGLINAMGALWFVDEIYGVPVYPVTLLMVKQLTGSFSIIPIIIAIYYGGELVWRDRERRVHEIVDATPAENWTFALPKVLAITAVLAFAILVSAATGMLVQALKGYFNFEPQLYLVWYVLPSLFFAFQIATLSILAQTLAPHKFIGWAIMGLYLVSTITLNNLGFDHPLYQYGSTPDMPLSDMNGAGHFAIGVAWFTLYWTLFAFLFVLAAYLLWRRGAETRLRPRLGAMGRALGGGAGLAAAALLAGVIGAGGYIFYNTNVLNAYEGHLATEQWTADLERALLRYENTPRPKVVAATLDVELHPRALSATTRGDYLIENRTGAPLSEIHVYWPRRLERLAVAVDGGTLAEDFTTHAPSFPYQIYRLSTPMQPGEQRHIRFTTRFEQRGFRANNLNTRVVFNGTFVDNSEITPALGFNRNGLLQDRNKRRKYGLPAELRMPRLEDESARAFNYLTHDADWTSADITVTTDADQTPIAPGYVVYDRTANGRRSARFRTDAPIMPYFSIQSARYQTRRDAWRNVNLAVYYDAHHAYNVDRMIRAMQASFDVFTERFSPFQFHQMRILEFPGYANFAQSFANTVPYSESIGFIARFDDASAAQETDKIDIVTYVTAHELGHQWWAHQVIGADRQGSTMLSETFAQYSAMLVMEHLYGPDQVRRFLRYELDRYLRARGGEAVEELPLMRVEDQPYIHYNKGSLVMYFLKNEVGEEVVNRALRRLIAQYAFHAAPYPSSVDFVRYLREEAGPRYDALITDLFERITLYDARVVSAETSRRSDGRWNVHMVVEAHKRYADGQGRETEAPLDEEFEIGVFTAEPGQGAFAHSDVVSFVRRPIHSGSQTLDLVVDRQPRFAGIDPYNKRIDRDADDNVMEVTAR